MDFPLDSTSIPMFTMALMPASRARAITSARSASKRSK
jgi:hypothetical protein